MTTPTPSAADALDAATKPFRPTLNLPRGSIRAFLALCVAGTSYFLLANPAWMGPGVKDLPLDLSTALLIVLGYYFADRAGFEDEPEDGRPTPPLFLPTGTVRTLLIVGFLSAVGYHVYVEMFRDKLTTNFMALTMAPVIINLGAFMFGRAGKLVVKGFVKSGRTGLANLVGDVKGVLGIVAGFGTVAVFVFPQYVPAEFKPQFQQLFPSIITFYFGTR